MRRKWRAPEKANIADAAKYVFLAQEITDKTQLCDLKYAVDNGIWKTPSLIPATTSGIIQSIDFDNLQEGRWYCFWEKTFNGKYWSPFSESTKGKTYAKGAYTDLNTYLDNPNGIIVYWTPAELTPEYNPYVIRKWSNYRKGHPWDHPEMVSEWKLHPGVVIKFEKTSGTNVSSLEEIKLNAQGTEINPIVFAPISDDGIAGDTDYPTQTTDSGIFTLTLAGMGNVLDYTLLRNVTMYGWPSFGGNVAMTNSLWRSVGAYFELSSDDFTSFVLRDNELGVSGLKFNGQFTIENNDFYGRLIFTESTDTKVIMKNNNIFPGVGNLQVAGRWDYFAPTPPLLDVKGNYWGSGGAIFNNFSGSLPASTETQTSIYLEATHDGNPIRRTPPHPRDRFDIEADGQFITTPFSRSRPKFFEWGKE